MKRLVVVLLVLVVTGCANLHQVDKWVWRAAQPEPGLLYDLIKAEQIVAVLNLRGLHPSERDFDLEEAVAGHQGVVLEGVALSSRRLPTRLEVLEVIGFFRTYDGEPVLVHCRAGADRTGLAVFLYLAVVRGWDKEEARDKGLSWLYGHIPLLSPKTAALDEFVDMWQGEAWFLEHYWE